MGALSLRASKNINNEYESLPPLMHTKTRSLFSIILKSVIALPVNPISLFRNLRKLFVASIGICGIITTVTFLHRRLEYDL